MPNSSPMANSSSRSPAPPPLSLETTSSRPRSGRTSSDAIPRTFSADSPQLPTSSFSSLGRKDSSSSSGSAWSPGLSSSPSSPQYALTAGAGTGRKSPPAQHSHHAHHSHHSPPTTPTSTAVPGRKSSGGPPVNVYTYCGRHTDQFLFGGKGIGDLFNHIVGKKD